MHDFKIHLEWKSCDENAFLISERTETLLNEEIPKALRVGHCMLPS